MKTIAVSEEAFQVLKELKKELAAKTFEEAILRAIKGARKVPESMFGIDKGMRPFTKADEKEFEGKEHGQ
jgi:predicted CopG family antitoxin